MYTERLDGWRVIPGSTQNYETWQLEGNVEGLDPWDFFPQSQYTSYNIVMEQGTRRNRTVKYGKISNSMGMKGPYIYQKK